MFRLAVSVLFMLLWTSLIGMHYDESATTAVVTGVPIDWFTHLFYASAWTLGMVVIPWFFRNYAR